MTTEEIRNYHKVDERVITGGQPAEGQLKAAFYSLYAMQHLDWSETQADELRAVIWRQANPVWDDFVRHMKHASGDGGAAHEQLS